MTETEIRAEFEKECLRRGSTRLTLSRDGFGYAVPKIQNRWEFWLAAYRTGMERAMQIVMSQISNRSDPGLWLIVDVLKRAIRAGEEK